MKTRRVGSTRRAAKKKPSALRRGETRRHGFHLKKKNDAEAVVASGRVVASVDICIVDLTVYRHNSLNSEGGACFQVTISRHVRRTRRGASASFDREKEGASRRRDRSTGEKKNERGLRASLDRD
jgi:hypothetical protein